MLAIIAPMLSGKSTSAARTPALADADNLSNHAGLVRALGKPSPDWTPEQWFQWDKLRDRYVMTSARALPESTVIMVHTVKMAERMGFKPVAGILIPESVFVSRCIRNPDREELAILNRSQVVAELLQRPEIPTFTSINSALIWLGARRTDGIHPALREEEK